MNESLGQIAPVNNFQSRFHGSINSPPFRLVRNALWCKIQWPNGGNLMRSWLNNFLSGPVVSRPWQIRWQIRPKWLPVAAAQKCLKMAQQEPSTEISRLIHSSAEGHLKDARFGLFKVHVKLIMRWK